MELSHLCETRNGDSFYVSGRVAADIREGECV